MYNCGYTWVNVSRIVWLERKDLPVCGQSPVMGWGARLNENEWVANHHCSSIYILSADAIWPASYLTHLPSKLPCLGVCVGGLNLFKYKPKCIFSQISFISYSIKDIWKIMNKRSTCTSFKTFEMSASNLYFFRSDMGWGAAKNVSSHCPNMIWKN